MTRCTPHSDPLIGQTLSGRYKLLERIGEGATSVVYKALQWPLKRAVGIKLSKPGLNRKQTRRFINEALILSNLKHPCTLKLIEFDRTECRRLYLVTEYIAGGSLKALMKKGRLDTHHALKIALQISRALAEAHGHGVIHRDIKPGNILFDSIKDEKYLVRLIDFGLAKRTGSHLDDNLDKLDLTSPGARIGSPGYMSPEQAFRKQIDFSVDLYGLGVILYEMLTGYQLFDSDSNEGLYMAHLYNQPAPFHLISPDLNIHPDIEILVMDLLSKDAQNRPRSAHEVAQRLKALLAQTKPEEARNLSPPPRPDLTAQGDEQMLVDWRREQRARLASHTLFSALLVILLLGFSLL